MSQDKRYDLQTFLELAQLDISKAEYEFSTGDHEAGVHFVVPGKLEEVLRAGLLSSRRPSSEEVTSDIIKLDLVNPKLLERLLTEPRLLQCLSWRDFERVLAGILERLGYEIELQRGTRDGGIDIFAIKRSDPFGVHRYLLQAKHWSKPVGVEPIRELMFLHTDHRMTKSCLATTSRFTRGAWVLAERYKWQLELKDQERLLEWIELFSGIQGHRSLPSPGLE